MKETDNKGRAMEKWREGAEVEKVNEGKHDNKWKEKKKWREDVEEEE